jgi:hypothetical protein
MKNRKLFKDREKEDRKDRNRVIFRSLRRGVTDKRLS